MRQSAPENEHGIEPAPQQHLIFIIFYWSLHETLCGDYCKKALGMKRESTRFADHNGGL